MAIGDQYFDKVVLGLNFDDGLFDISPIKRLMTPVGDAGLTSAAAKYGSWGLALDGAGDCLTTPLTSDLKLSSSDFTIEFWFKPGVVTGFGHLLGVWNVSGLYSYVIYRNTAGVQFSYSLNGTTQVDAAIVTTGLAVGVWAHIAVSRSGSSIRVFLNGVQVGATHTIGGSAIYDANTPLTIGWNTSGYGPEAGSIDDVRITKGIARYTANFTPPGALPFYYARVDGVIKDSLGNPARRLVRSHRRSDGMLAAEAVSEVSSGAFSLACIDSSKHYVVAHDSDGWITYLSLNGYQDFNSSLVDPYWNYCVLALPMDSMGVVDWAKAQTPTLAGGVGVSSAQSKFGGYSLLLDGVDDYVVIPYSSNIAMTGQDFTISCWFRPSALGGYKAIFAGATSELWIGCSGTEIEVSWAYAASICASTGLGLVINTWYHLEVSRVGATIYLFVNGVLRATAGGAAGDTWPSGLNIGRLNYASAYQYFSGNIDDVRLYKGVAIHTLGFTAPTAAVGLVGPYAIFSERNGLGVTTYGNAQIVTTQSKFGGACAQFDGAGDYALFQNSKVLDMMAYDFTIEMWVRFTSVAGTQGIFASHDLAAGVAQYLIYLNGGNLAFYSSSNGTTWNIASNATIKAGVVTGQWYHIAVVRSGSSILLFCDGVLTTTIAVGGSLWPIASNTPVLGRWAQSNYFNGHIDDFKVSKGAARYGVPFTPPTAAHFTMQAGDYLWNYVTLAMHMDDDALTDACGKVFTKYGAAAKSVATSKFGGASAYFNGVTTSYISTPAVDTLLLGNGDFTVDFWIYTNGVISDGKVIGIWSDTSSSGFSWRVTASNTALAFTYSTTGGDSVMQSVTFNSVANVWTHMAVGRKGSVLYLFVNGALLKTFTGQSFTCYPVTSAKLLEMGRDGAGPGMALNAYLDDVRITKGICRWSASYTPPAAAFQTTLEVWGQQNAMVYDYLTPI